MKTLSLTGDIEQSNPLAYLVFAFKSAEVDYMVFTDYRSAEDYACIQGEQAEIETWAIYPLFAGEQFNKPKSPRSYEREREID